MGRYQKFMHNRKGLRKTVNTAGKVVKYGAQGLGAIGTVANLAQKVAGLVSVINAEKKRFAITTSLATVAQYNQTGAATAINGCFVSDITPTPAQGVAYNQHEGSSIKLTSSYFKIQLYTQSAVSLPPVKVKIWIFAVKGSPINIATFVTNTFQTNPFLTTASYANVINDYNSPLDPDFFGTYSVLFQKEYLLPSCDVAGVLNIKDITIPMRYGGVQGKGKHIRFQDNATTVMDGQMIMIIMSNAGNSNAANVGVAAGGVPVTAVNTGQYLNIAGMHYYYDN